MRDVPFYFSFPLKNMTDPAEELLRYFSLAEVCLKISFFMALILGLSLNAYAGKAKLVIVDPNIDPEAFGEEFEIQSTERDSKLPDKNLRDDFLSGLPQIKDWDEWDKDLFYMELQYKSLDDLVRKYPDFSRKELKKLKEKRQ